MRVRKDGNRAKFSLNPVGLGSNQAGPGRRPQARRPLAYFLRLLRATPEQRLQYEMSGNGTGLHWEALDEDISAEGLLMGIGDQTQEHSQFGFAKFIRAWNL